MLFIAILQSLFFIRNTYYPSKAISSTIKLRHAAYIRMSCSPWQPQISQMCTTSRKLVRKALEKSFTVVHVVTYVCIHAYMNVCKYTLIHTSNVKISMNERMS